MRSDKLLTTILPKFKDKVRNSVVRNFEVGGRPTKWTPSKRSQLTHKSKADGISRKGKTLVDKGILRNSINTRIVGNRIVTESPVKYARIHNEGGTITGTFAVKSHTRIIKQAFGHPLKRAKKIQIKAHTRNVNIKIVKREFMLLQEVDYQYFANQIEENI